MTLRDKFKSAEYFMSLIDRREKINREWIQKCENGEVKPDRVNAVMQNIAWTYFTILSAKYSLGVRNISLLETFMNALTTLNKSWDGFWKLKTQSGKEYDQYILSAYDHMLWMLALGYLLDVNEKDFRQLVEVIDRDKVKDNLFEFIIRAKLRDRMPIQEESYCEYFGVPEVFSKLRSAIKEDDKQKAQQLIKTFLDKDWYTNHKDAGWYNNHKSKHDSYFGYWSFETAAVVKIMGLDDSSFRDCQYYPKDLV
jgi:hypothetical protein